MDEIEYSLEANESVFSNNKKLEEAKMDETREGYVRETEHEAFGGATKYQLNLIYLLDTSGSMYGERINQLNVAMADAVQIAKEAAMENEVQLLMRVVEFNNTAKWIFGSTEKGVEDIEWKDLLPSGGTDTAGAVELATSVMHRKYLGERNYRPVVILITDGDSNDPRRTVEAIDSLKKSLVSSTDPTKDKITRIAIGVQNANESELRAFASVGNIEHQGTLEENVPFVFKVDDLSLLKGIIKGITVSSIASTIGGGVDGTEVPVISADDPGDEDDWED